MTRTQILLPDELHERIRQFAAEKELSMTEVARRALESWLDRYPEESEKEWTLPVINGGGIKIPLKNLRDGIVEEEAGRSLS